MRGVACVAAGVIAAVFGCGCEHAFAETPADRERPDRFLLFSGLDLWQAGGFAHGGLLWSPGGLLREGFTFKVLVAGGSYLYRSGGVLVRGDQQILAAMPGWRFKRGGLEVTAFAGPDEQFHRLHPDDLKNALRGAHLGVRGGVDLWYEPANAMMLAASVSASSVGTNYWTRVALGWRVRNVAWVGPEVVALGDGNYRQFRVGVHVTTLRMWGFEWTTGLGYVQDSADRSGAYGTVGLIARR